jgi:hypothetical protein
MNLGLFFRGFIRSIYDRVVEVLDHTKVLIGNKSTQQG